MEGGSSRVRIDRKSSIESEPRTLTMDQIRYAREEALYVLNTRSIEEALSIFTEGFKPVVSAARINGDRMMDLSRREMEHIEDEQLQLQQDIRDVATAPF